MYWHLKPQTTVMRELYRYLFNSNRSSSNLYTKVDTPDVDAQTAELMIIVANYCKTYKAAVEVQYIGGPLPEDLPGLQAYLHSFTWILGGLVACFVPIIQITGNEYTTCSRDGSTLVKKKLKPSSRNAENGSFSILYPYGDEHEPSDMHRCLQYEVNSSFAGGSSIVN